MAQVPTIYLAGMLIVVVIIIVVILSLPRSSTVTTTITTTATGNVGVTTNASGTTSLLTTSIISTSVQTTTPPTTTSVSKNGSLSAWQVSSSYPLPIYNETCFGWTGYIYCIGGLISSDFATDSVYYARVSAQGIGTWKQAAHYIINVSAPSCALEANTVYCVGGMYNNGSAAKNAYYAYLTPNGISKWHFAVGYVDPIAGASCVQMNGNFYCVGGFNDTATSSAVNFAMLYNGTYQYWLSTNNYPVKTSLTTCVNENITVYCIAGKGSQNDYYDAITKANAWLGTWDLSGVYPLPAYAPSCVAGNGMVYCVGGYESDGAPISGAYYAELSPQGVGSWSVGPAYPSPGLEKGSCGFAVGYLYCIGGLNQGGATYFTQVS